MSACRCTERNRPQIVPAGSNQRPRQWVVLIDHESRSAFNGYQPRWSAMSYLMCRVCGSHWKTKMDISEIPHTTCWPQTDEPRVEPITDV